MPFISLLFVLCLSPVYNQPVDNETTSILSNETLLINETDLELTTSFLLPFNFSNDTIDLTLSDVEITDPVKRVLRAIFRSYEPYCWRHSYGRGVGRPLHTCPDDAPEQDGLLCYPLCREGYNGVGPVCWENCINTTSLGFACLDIRQSSRGCPWYDKCGLFKRSCTSCPDDYTNFGCFCGKFRLRGSYGRGIGTPLVCSKSYEQDGALCYDKCDPKYNGVGPVCWQHCPSTQPYPCLAGCSATKDDCRNTVINMVQSVIGASITLLNFLIGTPIVHLTTMDILANAAKGDWILVAKDMSILAGQLADKVLPGLTKKFFNWPFGTVESATKNASLLITTTAFKDKKSLLPFLKLFRLDSINVAFNHGKCNMPDIFDDIID